MKQFRDGKARLEAILSKNGEYMLRQFDSCTGQSVDIMNTLKSTALRSISVPLLGTALNDNGPLLEMLLKFERDLWIPYSLIYSNPGSICLCQQAISIMKYRKLQLECWEGIIVMRSESIEESLTKALLECASGGKSDSEIKTVTKLTERQAAISILDLIFAGIATNSRAFYFILNVMAFRTQSMLKSARY